MSENNPKTIYWDTSCFIALLNGEATRVDVCNAIIDAAKKQETTIYTSFLTMCEWSKVKGEYPTEADDKIVEFLRNPYIKLVAIDFQVSRITRDLVRNHKLDVRDAIHLATAIKSKVEILHSYDADDLLSLNGKIPGVNLQIIKPAFNFQIGLSKPTT